MNIKLKKWLALRWQDYCYHSWLFLLMHTTMHGSMNIKLKKWLGLRWQDYCYHSWLFPLIHTTMHGSMNIKFKKKMVRPTLARLL